MTSRDEERARGRMPRVLTALFFASLGAAVAAAFLNVGSDAPPGLVEYLKQRPPSLAYWFWTPDVLEREQWRTQAEDLAKRGHYNLIFATPRYPMPDAGDVDFVDTERFAPLFRETAKILAENSRKLALDLRFYLGVNRTVAATECERIVTAHRVTLDAEGRATIPGFDENLALFPTASPFVDFGLLAAYDAGSLERIDDVTATVDGPSLVVRGPAGRSIGVLAYRRHNHPDMFSEAYPRAFERTLRAYADVGLGGVGLDEFAYLPVRADRWAATHYYSPTSAAAFRAAHDVPLEDAIARIAFDADEASRRRWRLAYFAHRRVAIERMERRFYDLAKEVLGAATFVGVHPTNHNAHDLEFALTALDWWGVKRDFGQTDEKTPMAIRMALALKAGGQVWYNMFYDKDREKILDEIVRCARFGGRVHYHAYNDSFYGAPLEAPGWMERLATIHRRLERLLMARVGVPELDTLVVLGWPAMVEFASAGNRRVLRDMNTFLDALWDRGVRACAVASYEIAAGNLNIDEKGRAHYGGRTFDDVIVWHPEFSTKQTLQFLRTYRGRLRHIGRYTAFANTEPDAPRDFSSEAFSFTQIVEERLPEDGALLVRYPGEKGVIVDREALIDGGARKRRISWSGAVHSILVDGVRVLDLSKPIPRLRD